MQDVTDTAAVKDAGSDARHPVASAAGLQSRVFRETELVELFSTDPLDREYAARFALEMRVRCDASLRSVARARSTGSGAALFTDLPALGTRLERMVETVADRVIPSFLAGPAAPGDARTAYDLLLLLALADLCATTLLALGGVDPAGWDSAYASRDLDDLVGRLCALSEALARPDALPRSEASLNDLVVCEVRTRIFAKFAAERADASEATVSVRTKGGSTG